MGGTGSKSDVSQARGRLNSFSVIGDNFHSLEDVTAALRRAGLESSNLIIGVDATKSNTWTGRDSFGGRCLHALGEGPNPYEEAIEIIGRTLVSFDDDNLIPAYFFGDATTGDQAVFSFHANDRPCAGFASVLARYRQVISEIQLAGPTSFAPIVRQAMHITAAAGGAYHILLLLADGQVTRSADLLPQELSSQERDTVAAIVEASALPLSIIMVGLGDGPWEVMRDFDDGLPSRNFDNFQFVEWNRVRAKTLAGRMDRAHVEAQFALAALMEIPEQYKAIVRLNLLGRRAVPMRPIPMPLQPPPSILALDAAEAAAARGPAAASAPRSMTAGGSAAFGAESVAQLPPEALVQRVVELEEDRLCVVCCSNPRNVAFSCGHTVCADCASRMAACPTCRSPITQRITLYA